MGGCVCSPADANLTLLPKCGRGWLVVNEGMKGKVLSLWWSSSHLLPPLLCPDGIAYEVNIFDRVLLALLASQVAVWRCRCHQCICCCMLVLLVCMHVPTQMLRLVVWCEVPMRVKLHGLHIPAYPCRWSSPVLQPGVSLVKGSCPISEVVEGVDPL